MKDKINIISTASLPAEQLQRLEQQGFNAEVIPFIRTYPSVNYQNVQRIRQLQRVKTTVIFTSTHGVDAVVETLFGMAPWKIACISGATQEAVKKYFDEEDIIATAPNAKELAEEIIRKGTEQVIFFCGSKRLDTLPQQLANAGIEVEEIEVYTTELTPQTATTKAEAVLFFSTSAVESFFMKNILPENTICFAIGNTTADALREKVNHRIVVAENPGKKEMIDLVIKYYHEHS